MRVWYRFPDVEDISQSKSDNEIAFYTYAKHSAILCKMDRWFNDMGEKLSLPVEFKRHNDMLERKIKVAVCFEMREELAVLFKMRFGDGTIDY